MAILNRLDFELNRFELNSLKLEQLNECVASKLRGLIFCLYWFEYCVGEINYLVVLRSLFASFRYPMPFKGGVNWADKASLNNIDSFKF
jgi:hypothetical protein